MLAELRAGVPHPIAFVALYPLLALAAYWLFWRELQKGWAN